MKNIFENAYFGKPYKTRNEKKAIYHGSGKHLSKDGKLWIYHYLMIEPVTINILDKDMVINHYDSYINDNGIGRFANLKYCEDSGASAEYDIISEWEEPINEKELDEITKAYLQLNVLYRCDEDEQMFIDMIREAHKAGYRKAFKKIMKK